MKYVMVAALLLAGCKKGGGAKDVVGVSTKAKKPDTVLYGKGKSRVRDLEIQCEVEVDPDTNHVWTTLRVINHGEASHFLPSPTETMWMADRGGRVFYAVGASPSWKTTLPEIEPIYATLVSTETREWKVMGARAPLPLGDGPAQDFACAISQGPDGTHSLEAGGRAVGAVPVKLVE